MPRDIKSQVFSEKKASGPRKPAKDSTLPSPAVNEPATRSIDGYEKLLSSIPEFSGFGKLFKVWYVHFSIVSGHVDTLQTTKVQSRSLCICEKAQWKINPFYTLY